MEWNQLINGLQHIGIPTDDLGKTIGFYESIGFSCVHRTRNEAADEDVAFLRLGSLTIETYIAAHTPRAPGAINHIALDVDDIEAAWALARETGLALPEGEEIHFLPFWENGVRYFTLLGPNNEAIEFNQKL